MKWAMIFFAFAIFVIPGCATLGSNPSSNVSYSTWPASFQADYLWEPSDSKLSMAIQPKWVRVYWQEDTASRCIAFNFLGATLWDMTLKQSGSGVVRIQYRKGKRHPLSGWMAKMLGQMFFNQSLWQGWHWQIDETENDEGVLQQLVFTHRKMKRILKLHKVRVGPLEKSLFD